MPELDEEDYSRAEDIQYQEAVDDYRDQRWEEQERFEQE